MLKLCGEFGKSVEELHKNQEEKNPMILRDYKPSSERGEAMHRLVDHFGKPPFSHLVADNREINNEVLKKLIEDVESMEQDEEY